MAMHAVHKMLAAAADKTEVRPGEVITAKIDLAGINDVYLIVVRSFKEMLGEKVWDVDKVHIFLDHNAPASDLKVAEAHKAFREFAEEQGCHIDDINEGIGHNLLPERGLVRPGNIIVITDSHTPIHGAYGAFAAGLGATDMAAVLINGSTWFRVPDVINVRLDGKLQDGVMAKDAALYVLGQLGSEFGTYKVIEFSGSVVEALSMEERTVLTVMATEMGAKSTYIKPDKTTIDDIRRHTDAPFVVHETDPDFKYAEEYVFDLTNLKSQVAVPHSVENARDVDAVEGIPINQVFVGSCTGGKRYDIEVVAKALEGKKIAPNTRLVVTMATKDVLKESIEKGYYQILVDAGATINSPGCGACSGLLGGIIAAKERCVSTANRNFPGRMGGSVEAEVYLTSPLTAAATALTGKLISYNKL
ncbi:MAG: 3-isopropylmalate dehydratase [Firmicutes bacterium]|nr:3-isopropylmalate dehydratase [Bacillota bacterium]